MIQAESSQYSLLRDLIQIRSYSGEEKEILTSIETHLHEQGVQAFRQDSNVVVHFEGSNKEKALIFDSHTDTVSADEGLWGRFAPFGPHAGQVENEKMYGLGASDMKSGVFAQMKIAEYIQTNGMPPCDIWMTFVVEEETSGRGTNSFAQWFFSQNFRYKEVGVIIPEPTDLTNFFIGQRGNYSLRVRTE